MKCTRDAILSDVESSNTHMTKNLAHLYKAANVIRETVLKSKRWVFAGSLTEVENDVVPSEIEMFFKWCMQGKTEITNTKPRQKADVSDRAKVMSQTLMSSCLSQRQVQNLVTKDLHHKR